MIRTSTHPRQSELESRSDLLTFLRHTVPESFGRGDTAHFECRYRQDSLPEKELERVVTAFQRDGWRVDSWNEDDSVVLQFTDPPAGSIPLNSSDQRQLQTLLGRLRKFIAAGLPEGQGNYPFLERVPYRVVACAAEILRMDGWQVTLISGAGGHLKSAVIGIPVPSLAEAQLPTFP